MEFQVADLFEAVSDQIPEREALVLGKKRLTYAQLDKRSNKAAHMLKKIGIGKGDHIGIYAYNCIEWIEVMIGAYKIGAVPININYRYVEEELAYLIGNSDMVAIVYQYQFAPLLKAIEERTPKLKKYIHIKESGEELPKSFNKKSREYKTLIDVESEERGLE